MAKEQKQMPQNKRWYLLAAFVNNAVNSPNQRSCGSQYMFITYACSLWFVQPVASAVMAQLRRPSSSEWSIFTSLSALGNAHPFPSFSLKNEGFLRAVLDTHTLQLRIPSFVLARLDILLEKKVHLRGEKFCCS